ncbi:class I SAM-dependent methyltransferase [Corynebacterium alimapuense]|uniref:SAM-dependent methyltransferase n=1 Tax=Corynebacterium alimapuense TaxID=1576874 RepID=A0A3M8K8Y1_9CORY|nr:class I SAM-dependent methyltransferase [Corynebacterium alimapuense]RNE48974.1 SAM-dependent methyltransferase [Corynebacterium alimapuense]
MADHAHNLRAEFGRGRPFGVITRGTTGFNRLRRSDRWTIHQHQVRSLLAHADSPLAIDVGYGGSYTTTVEWSRALRTLRPDVRTIGLEIDPQRVLPPREGVHFELGGFELAGYRPHMVRAFNVLRQYDIKQVEQAWEMVCSRLAPGGLFVEGTCDELGRRAAWLLLDAQGPLSLTLAWDPFDVSTPSELAERLPKALIHRNVPGEPIHALLCAADRAWEHAAGWESYGPRVRWAQARQLLIHDGVPLAPIRRKIRDNVLTVPWEMVAPTDGHR